MFDLTNRWVALALLFLVGVTAPMHLQAVAALAPFLIAEAGLTYTDIGVLSGLFMAPGILLAAPSGMLAAWLGDRLSLMLGIAVMAASAVAFAFTESYWVMAVSRVVGGAGAVVVTMLLPKVVTDWFVGKEIATGMSIIAASVGVGIGVAMALLPALASAASWQTAMIVNAGIAASAILILMIYRDCPPKGAVSGKPPALWQISRVELALAALAGMGRGLFSAGYFLFMSFLPALLIAQGMAPVEAGVLTSTSAIASLISVPFFGYLSDRTGKPNYFIVGGAIGATVACVLVPYIAPALIWILLFGLLRGGCTGGLMSLPSEVLSPQSRTTGFAIVSAIHFVCMATLPPLCGYLLDATGNPAAPLLFTATVWLSITLVLGVFRLLQRRWIE